METLVLKETAVPQAKKMEAKKKTYTFQRGFTRIDQVF